MSENSKEEEPHDNLSLPTTISPSSQTPSIGKTTRWELWKQHMSVNVDPERSVVPLVAYCFMTGYIDAVSFTATFIWCAFQTGNTIQLGLAIARLFTSTPRDLTFHQPDQQALCSLLSFLLGGAICRISEHRWFGGKRRNWVTSATFLQAILTMGAALASHYSGEGSFAGQRGDPPSWITWRGFLALALISASMGLQAGVGTRLGSHFATSVVLTTIWIQIVGDPKLFHVAQRVAARDNRLLAVLFLLIGGIVGRALVDTLGAPATLGIGAGVRALIALGWLGVPAAKQ